MPLIVTRLKGINLQRGASISSDPEPFWCSSKWICRIGYCRQRGVVPVINSRVIHGRKSVAFSKIEKNSLTQYVRMGMKTQFLSIPEGMIFQSNNQDFYKSHW